MTFSAFRQIFAPVAGIGRCSTHCGRGDYRIYSLDCHNQAIWSPVCHEDPSAHQVRDEEKEPSLSEMRRGHQSAAYSLQALPRAAEEAEEVAPRVICRLRRKRLFARLFRYFQHPIGASHQRSGVKFTDSANIYRPAGSNIGPIIVRVSLLCAGGNVCATRVVSLLSEIRCVRSSALRGAADTFLCPSLNCACRGRHA